MKRLRFVHIFTVFNCLKIYHLSALLSPFVVTISFLSIHVLSEVSNANPFFEHLRSEGRSSYSQDEYRAFVRSNIGQFVDAIMPDIKNVAEQILRTYNPETHFFVDIGSGPAPVAAYLQNTPGVLRANIPLSGFADAVDERGFFIKNPLPDQARILPESDYLKILKNHFDHFLPREALATGRTIVIIDTVQGGTTLINAHRRLSDYVHAINPIQEVKALGLLHPGVKPIAGRPSLNIENEDQIKERLKSFRFISLQNTVLGSMLYSRVFQEFSEFTRFEPGRDQSDAVTRSPLFEELRTEVKKRMGILPQRSCLKILRFS